MQIQGETSVNKLIVLFVFDKMESALSERTIVEMCTTSNNWLNYMDCMELLPKLLEDGFICRLSSDEEPALHHHHGREREPQQFLHQHTQKRPRGDFRLRQKEQRQASQPSGMQGGLLSEQGRHLHRISENHRPR